MRIGINPEKTIFNKISYKTHRIIIPVFIPESSNEYYENLFKVLKCSINSLIKTIDKENTAITIINNGCKAEVSEFIDELYKSKVIDKHSKYTYNLGKLYSVLTEVKGAFEDVITIADADVLYYSNWQSETINVFNEFEKIGVVSPLPTPQISFYNNFSLFSNVFIKKKKGRIVSKESIILFNESVGNDNSYREKKWFSEQYFLKNKNLKVCIGAGHFVATYRGDILRRLPFIKPEDVFKKGYENEFIDKPIDVMGYYRVSLIDTYAYHLGNSIPDWVKEHKFKKLNKVELKLKNKKTLNLPYFIKKISFRILKKILFN